MATTNSLLPLVKQFKAHFETPAIPEHREVNFCPGSRCPCCITCPSVSHSGHVSTFPPGPHFPYSCLMPPPALSILLNNIVGPDLLYPALCLWGLNSRDCINQVFCTRLSQWEVLVEDESWTGGQDQGISSPGILSFESLQADGILQRKVTTAFSEVWYCPFLLLLSH